MVNLREPEKTPHTTDHGTLSVLDKMAPIPNIRSHASYPTKIVSPNTNEPSTK
jgi:hypothetical protein